VQLAQQALKTPSNFKPFEVFHFAGHTLTGRQLCDAITKLQGAPTKIGSMPWRVITLGGIVVPMWRELVEMRYLWTTAHALDGSKLVSRIGPIQQTPIDEALQNTLSVSTSRSL
jgi:nucleoside-diphosphate-sugar epimerase